MKKIMYGTMFVFVMTTVLAIGFLGYTLYKTRNELAAGLAEIQKVHVSTEGHLYIDGKNTGITSLEGAGLQGETGPQGPQGDVGPQGEVGAQGPQGIQGIAGEIGPQGLQGETGATGPQGEVGPQGETGTQGESGPQGPQGDVGPEGPQGDIGPQGEVGAQGPQGIQGVAGDIGPQGLQGETGAQGPQGEPGPQGETGTTGPQGDVGPQGPQGDIGPQGETGVAGLQGEPGPQGDIGPQGPQGDVGPQGETGAAGPQGEPGTQISKTLIYEPEEGQLWTEVTASPVIQCTDDIANYDSVCLDLAWENSTYGIAGNSYEIEVGPVNKLSGIQDYSFPVTFANDGDTMMIVSFKFSYADDAITLKQNPTFIFQENGSFTNDTQLFVKSVYGIKQAI